jgi:hypothetical protein
MKLLVILQYISLTHMRFQVVSSLEYCSSALDSLRDQLTSQNRNLTNMTSSFDSGHVISVTDVVRLNPAAARVELSTADEVDKKLRARADAAWRTITDAASKFRGKRGEMSDNADFLRQQVAQAVTVANASRQQRTSLDLAAFDGNITHLGDSLDRIKTNASGLAQYTLDFVVAPEVARVRELVDAIASNVSMVEALVESNYTSLTDVGLELSGTIVNASNILSSAVTVAASTFNFSVRLGV